MNHINADRRYPQLCIFPEGCTTNGKTLVRFKRGAFEPLDPIQPIYIEYQSPFYNVSYDSLPTVLHVIFTACQPCTRIVIHRLPVIYPTDYMFQRYERWGNTKAEIYAEVAREIYCKTYGLGKSTLSLVDKGRLVDYLYDFTKPKMD